MALRAVSEHPKLARLKSILGCPRYQAMGALETLWHFVGKFTPRGDIGKYTDAEIEAWLEWGGEPGAMVAALTESGWIDPHSEHRLIVHDWHEHADKATKSSLRRKNVTFVVQCAPIVTQGEHGVRSVGGHITNSGALPEPEPEPEAEADEPRDAHLDPSAGASGVLCGLSLSGKELRCVLEDVMRSEQAHGSPPKKTMERMVAIWPEYQAEKAKLEFHWGAAKFFGEGYWRDKTSWPWRPTQAAKDGSRKIESMKPLKERLAAL